MKTISKWFICVSKRCKLGKTVHTYSLHSVVLSGFLSPQCFLLSCSGNICENGVKHESYKQTKKKILRTYFFYHVITCTCLSDNSIYARIVFLLLAQGFFRRSIQQKIQYRPCLKNQQCNIMRVNRNRCQYCRWVQS